MLDFLKNYYIDTKSGKKVHSYRFFHIFSTKKNLLDFFKERDLQFTDVFL